MDLGVCFRGPTSRPSFSVTSQRFSMILDALESVARALHNINIISSIITMRLAADSRGLATGQDRGGRWSPGRGDGDQNACWRLVGSHDFVPRRSVSNFGV